MNTDASSKPSGRVLEGPKKVLTAEQKERKNELARALRAKKRFEKQVMRGSSPSAEIEEEDAEDTDDTEDTRVTQVTQVTRVTQVTEDPEITRKKEIAEKRRASLALARSKIKPKSQITKEKNEEIEKMREENERLKEEAEKAKQVVPMKPKVLRSIYEKNLNTQNVKKER